MVLPVQARPSPPLGAGRAGKAGMYRRPNPREPVRFGSPISEPSGHCLLRKGGDDTLGHAVFANGLANFSVMVLALWTIRSKRSRSAVMPSHKPSFFGNQTTPRNQ